MTSLYLAAKIEEDYKKIRDVINVCYSTLHKDKPPLDIGETYWALRDSITQCELLIMRILKFQVSFKHPHKYMLNYIKSLRDWIPESSRRGVPLWSTAWSMLQDSYHGDICRTCGSSDPLLLSSNSWGRGYRKSR